MNYFKIDYKLSFYLLVTFIIMTVIGTLTHEFGHYSIAKILGYQSTINYKSTSYRNPQLDAYFINIAKKYGHEIKVNKDFPEKKQYIKKLQKYLADQFWITLGGPLQTMLTGTLGFLLLIFYKKNLIFNEQIKLAGWVLIFMSLFWLRQIANLFIMFYLFISKENITHFGDEMNLANQLGINVWSIQILTGIIGIIILTFLLKLIPKKIVLTFLFSGLIGSSIGFYLWIIKFGKFILP